MHFLVLRFHSYYNFCLTLVLLKDHTNVPMLHMQVKVVFKRAATQQRPWERSFEQTKGNTQEVHAHI